MATVAKRNNPWEVCRAAAGDKADQLPKLLSDMKARMGLHQDLSEDQYIALMQFGELEMEIFEQGTHGGKSYDAADIAHLQKTFEDFGRDLVQPPLVLGHDEEQKLLAQSGLPAAGWLKGLTAKLKPNGNMSIIGRFQDVPEVVRQAVEKRAYKRVSSEIYQNFANPNIKGGVPQGLTFRRIALLGADVPEVKTLADVVAYGESTEKFLYAEHKGESDMDAATIKAMQDQIQKLSETSLAHAASVKTLSDENASLKAMNDSLKKDVVQSALREKSAAIASFIELQRKEGKILPSMEERGLQRFMESLDSGKVLKFSDAKDAQELSAVEFFKELVKGLPNLVRLSEVSKADLEGIAAAKNKQAAGDGKMNVSLDGEVKKYQESMLKAGTVISYGEALRHVASSRPELAEKFEKE